MKRSGLLALTIVASLSLLAGCGSTNENSETAENAGSAVSSDITESSEAGSGATENSDVSSRAAESSTVSSPSEISSTAEPEGSSSVVDPSGGDKVSLHIDGYDSDNIPRLDGSLANEPLLMRMMEELTGADEETAEVYLADSFENGGTSTSWSKLLWDEMDLIISYEAPDEVKEELGDEMEQLEVDPLGCDGLVFIVNVNNPIESLTVDQIRDIYTGKITNWSEVGGEDSEIKAFQRNSTSGSQTLLNKLVMKGEEPMEPEKELLVGTMGELIENVAAFDGEGSAIGFSVYYYADKMKSDPNLKMIQVEGVAPSNESIESKAYPLVNDFYIAIRKSEGKNSPARALRDFMLSEDGKKLLEEEGYVWAGDK